MFDDVERDLSSIVLADWGSVVSAPTVGWTVVGPDGIEIDPIRRFLLDFVARGNRIRSVYSYAHDLLRWWRWLAAVDVPWDQATPAEVRDLALGHRQSVEMTDVAVVGDPDDTAAVVGDLVAQLPDGMANSTVTEDGSGARITTVPVTIPAPDADRYLLLPVGGHRVIEARRVRDLPLLSRVDYLIEVAAGGERIVVHHPQDGPRERRVDITMDASARQVIVGGQRN